MIQDLTDSLREILQTITPVVSLSPPSDVGSGNAIHLYLYDIRENTELRSNEPRVVRQNGKATIEAPPVRIDCTYLIAARGEDGTNDDDVLKEHELLSRALTLLSGMRTIPSDKLKGSLKDQTPPLPLLTAQPNALANPAEFWNAIGAKIRASLIATVTISLAPPTPSRAPVVKTHEIQGIGDPWFAIGGRLTNASNQPVEGAEVNVVGRARRSVTDAEGRFRFRGLPMGDYVLHVESSSGTTDKQVSIPSTHVVALIRFAGDENEYPIAARQDDNTLALNDDLNPGADIADSKFTVTLSSSFSEGQVTYDDSTRQVTLTGAAWPAFDPTDDQVEAIIRLGAADHPIAERSSDTVLVLSPDDKPAVGQPLTDYILLVKETFSDGRVSYNHADATVVLQGATWPLFEPAVQNYDIRLS
jgi:hypothetical protein